jgi:toxin ParE1/3/4
MSGYILTPAAQEDLTDIRDYYLEEAGRRVARQMLVEFVEAFRFLARTPGAGHKREDLAEERPILFWPMRDYLILYKPDSAPLRIITIARAAETYRQSLADGNSEHKKRSTACGMGRLNVRAYGRP